MLMVRQAQADGSTAQHTSANDYPNLRPSSSHSNRTEHQAMTIIQQIQLRKHVSDMLRRRGIQLGAHKEYEKRVYNIYERVWKRST